MLLALPAFDARAPEPPCLRCPACVKRCPFPWSTPCSLGNQRSRGRVSSFRDARVLCMFCGFAKMKSWRCNKSMPTLGSLLLRPWLMLAHSAAFLRARHVHREAWASFGIAATSACARSRPCPNHSNKRPIGRTPVGQPPDLANGRRLAEGHGRVAGAAIGLSLGIFAQNAAEPQRLRTLRRRRILQMGAGLIDPFDRGECSSPTFPKCKIQARNYD